MLGRCHRPKIGWENPGAVLRVGVGVVVNLSSTVRRTYTGNDIDPTLCGYSFWYAYSCMGFQCSCWSTIRDSGVEITYTSEPQALTVKRGSGQVITFARSNGSRSGTYGSISISAISRRVTT